MIYYVLGTLKPADVPSAWIDMVDPCVKVMENQVKIEIEAAMTYLAMVIFKSLTINNNGFLVCIFNKLYNIFKYF